MVLSKGSALTGQGGTPMDITIKDEDIEEGKRRDFYGCPLARALRREFPGQVVGSGNAIAWIGLRRYALPVAVQAFILAFDAGKPVSPCSFRMGQEVFGRANQRRA